MVLARRPVRGRARLAAQRICGVCLRASLHESRGPFSARDDLLNPPLSGCHDFTAPLSFLALQCGVTGHTVIVHKGCPANSDDPCDPGVRIGCCVLA